MAQRIFQSFRRLPGHLASFRKKQEATEVRGNAFKINVCCDYGFPSKPASISYDPVLDLLALLTRDGGIFIFGRPGVVFTGTHNVVSEFIEIVFLKGTKKLITVTGTDDIYLWELSSEHNCVRLSQVTRLPNATANLSPTTLNGSGIATDGSTTIQPHITSVCPTSDNRSFLIGTDNGWVASIRLNPPPKSPFAQQTHEYLSPPSRTDALSPERIASSIPSRQSRLDAVVVLSERPGFTGQLLIGYNSGLSVLFDLRLDRVVAILPWKHGLESATWCGGNGLPNLTSSSVEPAHLGLRLLTAHSDGSLGVWDLKDTGLNESTSSSSSPHTDPPSLTMEEPPTMPYGPFPCKLISKVFWLLSPSGGITAFAGGMPRSTYGERHTVSLLRGSNLDAAAVANVIASRVAALEQDDDDDSLLDSSQLTAGTPIHVFDPDAPEHVCFDLPSRLIDLLPVGPIGGPTQMLLLLCEEELVAIDLISPGWPFVRPPYLVCLHPAAVSAYSLFTQVSPQMLSRLESAGAQYGPEGRFGRGHTISTGPQTAGWSDRPWPIQGGQALVSGSRLSSSSLDEKLLFTDDLLVTGHEDGTVIFWRLSAGGCARRIYTLHTAVLFEGEFGLNNHSRDLDEETDSWPPFRQAGLFDPFMDDSRAAVQLVRLVDNTVVVGGAAGQTTVWQFLDYAPPLVPVTLNIKTEIPGFQWKGQLPMKLRADLGLGSTVSPHATGHPAAELQAVAVLLTQPPARCTALNVTETQPSSPASHNPGSTRSKGVIVTVGTPHGFGVVYVPPLTIAAPPDSSSSMVEWKGGPPPPPQVLVCETTLPDNLDALQEAAVGEGWARRRTRELKKSLRDSFRRLKRMRSTKQTTPAEPQPATQVTRTGIRRTVTQSYRGVGRHTDVGPLEEAELRAKGLMPTTDIGPPAPTGIEREICERPMDSANAAVVSHFTFGPPLFRFSSSSATQAINHPVGSLFVGTKAGVVKAYAVFADENPTSAAHGPTTFRLQLAKQLILQHRAPILHLRVVDNRSLSPLSPSALYSPTSVPTQHSTLFSLLVVSEEQVRLFALPALRLRYKARITAKDGYRIKAGSLVSFRPPGKVPPVQDKTAGVTASGDLNNSNTTVSGLGIKSESGDAQGSEFAFAFTNVGGQAVVLSMPQLVRRDTLALLDSCDVVAVSSVVFAQPGTTGATGTNSVIGPSLGLYQLAPGQVTLFDFIRTGQRASLLGASYRPIQRFPESTPTRGVTLNNYNKTPFTLSNGSTTDSSGFASLQTDDRRFPRFMAHTTTACSVSYSGSLVNSSMLSDTRSDSIRDCLTPPSGNSLLHSSPNARRQVT